MVKVGDGREVPVTGPRRKRKSRPSTKTLIMETNVPDEESDYSLNPLTDLQIISATKQLTKEKENRISKVVLV